MSDALRWHCACVYGVAARGYRPGTNSCSKNDEQPDDTDSS